MKNRFFYFIVLLVSSAFLISCQQKPYGREEVNFNFGWKFFKGDTAGVPDPSFDDGKWRDVDLPHDWSIEGPFSKEYASGTGYLPGGTGWYRKVFTVPASEKGRKIFIDFGGVYNNSEVWINGSSLGKRPNGYISFQYDLTPYIKFGKSNVITVKVDHSKFADSRWYTGSGIYRNVKLVYTPEIHIRNWGVFANPVNVTSEQATLNISAVILNESDLPAEVTVSNYLLFGTDTVNKLTGNINIESSGEYNYNGEMIVESPVLWFIDNPYLYSLVTIVKCHGDEDKEVTGVGFRDARFDPDWGFFLNGVNMKLKGICMHHDAGTLGAAVPSGVIEHRLRSVEGTWL